MENSVFESGLAATCTLKLDRSPTAEVISKIEADEKVVTASLLSPF
jgi:hypothetical protein